MTVSGPHRHPFVAPFAFYLGMFNILVFPIGVANARSAKTTGEQDGCQRWRWRKTGTDGLIRR